MNRKMRLRARQAATSQQRRAIERASDVDTAERNRIARLRDEGYRIHVTERRPGRGDWLW